MQPVGISDRSFQSDEAAQLTGADGQWLRRWTKANTLRVLPETRRGSGTQLRWRVGELFVAAFLARIARVGHAPAMLHEIAGEVRHQLENPRPGGWVKQPALLQANHAVFNGEQAWAVIAFAKEPRWRLGVAGSLDELLGLPDLDRADSLLIFDLHAAWRPIFEAVALERAAGAGNA